MILSNKNSNPNSICSTIRINKYLIRKETLKLKWKRCPRNSSAKITNSSWPRMSWKTWDKATKPWTRPSSPKRSQLLSKWCWFRAYSVNSKTKSNSFRRVRRSSPLCRIKVPNWPTPTASTRLRSRRWRKSWKRASRRSSRATALSKSNKLSTSSWNRSLNWRPRWPSNPNRQSKESRPHTMTKWGKSVNSGRKTNSSAWKSMI